MSKLIDMTGQKFGKLSVIQRAENTKGGQAQWICECDCGKTVIVRGVCLRSGHSTSCGCKTREATIKRNFKHGETNTRLYKIWNGMKKRVNIKNKNDFHYIYYTGKGVKMCDEWYDFLVFKEWALSHNYADDLTIDRIDCEGDYTPDNCRWANITEQANNKTTNVFITHKGRTRTARQWSDETGITYSSFMSRYHKGWRGDKLFSEIQNKR